MVEKGRNGDVIETSLLKEVIGSFGITPSLFGFVD
jgi:hypothetical protein